MALGSTLRGGSSRTKSVRTPLRRKPSSTHLGLVARRMPRTCCCRRRCLPIISLEINWLAMPAATDRNATRTAPANASSHTGLSFNLLALLFLAHTFIPKARIHTHKFFHLAYYSEQTGKYGIGFDDAYFITFCIVLFTGLRAGMMEYVLAPFARLQGVTKRKTLTRFSEQAWLLVYYCFFWTLGVVCHCRHDSPDHG